jgi:hypothetical protein
MDWELAHPVEVLGHQVEDRHGGYQSGPDHRDLAWGPDDAGQ